MKRLFTQGLLASLVAAAAIAMSGWPVSAAPIIYGSLGNFDVINDTGKPCNGFEIELEGVSPGEVVYTFGDTGGPNPTLYIRYGKPAILPNVTGTGTIVRYASKYDSINKTFLDATRAAQSPYPVTMGHQCWYFGDPQNYPTSGCEHFGVSLVKNPTNTTYRWLVGNDLTGTLSVATINGPTPGSVIPAPVNVPPPVWNVNQPPPQVPGDPLPPPQVVAVVQAPPAPPLPPGGKGRWGEAIWMKIYKTELPQAADLDDMVLGGNNQHNPGLNIVPNPEVEPPEIEWQLLQSPPIGKSGNFEKSENSGEPGAGNEAVLRRYEYYKYTGKTDQDPENFGEALCDNPTAPEKQTPDKCGAPDTNGVAGVGDLLGAQNAAANLVPLCAADVSDSIGIKRSGYSFNFGTRLYSQKITLTNTGKATVFGPLSLALDNMNLSGADGLYNLKGKTSCTAPQNSPYINVAGITSTTGLAPGASVSVVVQFSNANRTGINYTPRVLATAGSR